MHIILVGHHCCSSDPQIFDTLTPNMQVKSLGLNNVIDVQNDTCVHFTCSPRTV